MSSVKIFSLPEEFLLIIILQIYNRTVMITEGLQMDEKLLETFDNPGEQDYLINIELPEFTALCPITGNPDFATIVVSYIPDKLCVELKSIKLFINSFRNDGVFHEAVTNQIFSVLQKLLNPKYMRVIGDFNRRGNVKTVITVQKTFNDYNDVDVPEYKPKVL
jgi:7-cyano-7-deazaguanine reductase